jgi:hypothetical protein
MYIQKLPTIVQFQKPQSQGHHQTLSSNKQVALK